MKMFFRYNFINWNEYIRIERGNLYHANNIKQNEKRFVKYAAKQRYEGEYPVTLFIRPHFKDRRRDLDNYRLKGLIDGLVAAGVIRNDNLNCIDKIVVEAVFNDVEGVEVEIIESEDADEKS